MAGKILVTGASGTVGRELVLKLQAENRDFIAASRTVEKFPVGVRGYVMDFESPALMEHAFRDVDYLFFISPLGPQMLKQAADVLAAAKKAGVRFILRSSGLGANPQSSYLLFRLHGEVEEMVRESGIPYAFLKPNAFMQNFINIHGDSLRQGALYLPQGEARTSYVDVRDIAEFAEALLRDPFVHHGRSYTVTGSRPVSIAEVVSILSYQAERRISYVSITEEASRHILEQQGRSPWMRDMVLSYYQAAREGVTAKVTDALPNLLQREPRTIEDFVQENAKFWKAPKTPWSDFDL